VVEYSVQLCLPLPSSLFEGALTLVSQRDVNQMNQLMSEPIAASSASVSIVSCEAPATYNSYYVNLLNHVRKLLVYPYSSRTASPLSREAVAQAQGWATQARVHQKFSEVVIGVAGDWS
jgi:hypothetical protein